MEGSFFVDRKRYFLAAHPSLSDITLFGCLSKSVLCSAETLC